MDRVKENQSTQNNKTTQLSGKSQYITVSIIILNVNNLNSLNKDANGTIGFKSHDPTISAYKKHIPIKEKYTD